MKKIIGVVLLMAVLTALISATCAVWGWKDGLALWGKGFVISLIICIAIILIEDSE